MHHHGTQEFRGPSQPPSLLTGWASLYNTGTGIQQVSKQHLGRASAPTIPIPELARALGRKAYMVFLLSSPHLTILQPNLFRTLSPAHRGMNLWTQLNLSTQHHAERRWKNSPWTAAQEARLCWGQLTTGADRGRNWSPHMGSCPPVTRPDRGLDTDQSDWHLFLSLGQEVTMKEK